MDDKIQLYTSADGVARLEIRLERDTLWLSQAQMAELFDKDSDSIGLHLKGIYQTGELDESATTEECSVVRTEGKRQVRRNIRFYNLDAVISVGYRVNSVKGTQFRIWATRMLQQHLVQGYTLNQRRLQERGKGELLAKGEATARGFQGDRYSQLLEKTQKETYGTHIGTFKAVQAA